MEKFFASKEKIVLYDWQLVPGSNVRMGVGVKSLSVGLFPTVKKSPDE